MTIAIRGTIDVERDATLKAAAAAFSKRILTVNMRDIPSQAADREHRNIRCRRLIFRCWHRGTQESDLILGPFAEDTLESLDSCQLRRFEALLDCTDPDLFDWIFGVTNPLPEHDHDVLQLLRSFCADRHRRLQQEGQHRV